MNIQMCSKTKWWNIQKANVKAVKMKVSEQIWFHDVLFVSINFYDNVCMLIVSCKRFLFNFRMWT
jgi:hypothetical protein